MENSIALSQESHGLFENMLPLNYGVLIKFE